MTSGGDNDGENFLSNPSVDYVATFLCKDGFMRMISGFGARFDYGRNDVEEKELTKIDVF